MISNVLSRMNHDREAWKAVYCDLINETCISFFQIHDFMYDEIVIVIRFDFSLKYKLYENVINLVRE